MDDLAALALQIEWGADEALADQPLDRRAARLAAAVRAEPAPAERATPAVRVAPSAGAPAGSPLQRAQAAAAAAGDLAALRAAVAAFDGCALRATATNLVFGEGDPAGAATLVADVPGAAEDRAGQPFAGPAGAFLDRMLASIGLDRRALYTCSMLPWRPPGDRKPADGEVQVCLPFFWRHLALVRPRRVVLLGNLAARTLLPAVSGRRAGGLWHALVVPNLEYAVPTIALSSPAAIQAAPRAKRDAWSELLRLRQAIDEDATTP